MAVVTPLTACFATSSIVFNTWSVFVVPVCDTFGTSTESFTWYVSIIYLASAIAAPIAGSLVQKHDVRFIYTAAVALCAVGIGACSFYTGVWQFYVSGALEGVGVGGDERQVDVGLRGVGKLHLRLLHGHPLFRQTPRADRGIKRVARDESGGLSV